MKAQRPLLLINAWLIGVAGLLILIQIILSVLAPQYATQDFYTSFGLSLEGLKHGHFWAFFTYGFLHHPTMWSHLLFNVFALLYLGGRVSHILTPKRCFLILSLSVLGGGAGELIAGSIYKESYPLIGISGGILGLFATLVTLSPDTRFWPFPIRGENILRSYVAISVILLLIPASWLQQDWFSEDILRIGHGCHLGGILVGYLFAKQILRLPRLKNRY